MASTTKYVICRILGNELPPRDLPGSRLAVFDYIFSHEHLDQQAQRIWILNRIIDPDMVKTIKNKLNSAGERYIELGIDWDVYASAYSRQDKINALIGLNNARNEAFKVGARLGELVFVLDGDCFFNERIWRSA